MYAPDEDWPPSAEQLLEDSDLLEEIKEFYPDHFSELLEEHPELASRQRGDEEEEL